MSSPVLSIKVVSDVANAVAGLGQVEGKTGKLNRTMKQAGPYAAGAVAGLAALGKQAFDAASAAQQSAGAVDAVFGAHAAGVHQLANQAAQQVGLAKSEYSQLAAVIGSQLKNMGVSQDALAGQTDNLVSLGADLAAQFGGDTSSAVEALSSLLRGERDPIEKYGVSIKQADIEAKKAQMGLAGLTGEQAKAADTQATLALLAEQTASAQGAFAREADTAAGAQQRATAQWENASATLGETLLPVVSQAATKLAEFGRWAEQNAGLVQGLAVAIGVIAAAILAYNVVMKAVAIAQAVATAAQWAWNVAVTANPIGLIIVAVAALIAIIVVLVMNWDKVKEVALKVWDAIVGAVQAAWAWLKKIAAQVLAVYAAAWRKIKSDALAVWDAIVNFVRRVIDAHIQLIRRVMTTARNVWNTILSTARAAWNRVKQVVVSVVSAQINTVRRIIGAVRSVFDQVRSTIRGAMDSALAVVRGIVDRIVGVFDRIISRARSIAGAVSNVFSSIRLPSLPWPFAAGPVDLTAAVATTPAEVTAASVATPSFTWPTSTGRHRGQSGPTVQIIIQGALDKRGVAHQVRDLLNYDARVRGAVDLAGTVV